MAEAAEHLAAVVVVHEEATEAEAEEAEAVEAAQEAAQMS